MVSAAIRYWVRLRTLVLVGLSCTLLGCGSGYAVLFSDGSSTAPPVEEDPPPPPTLIARDGTRLPLSLKDKTTKPMQIGLQDVPVPASLATVQVEVRALNGAAVDSPLTVYQASTKTVRFLYDVPNIRAELDRRGQELDEADVPAQLAVLVDGVEAAPPLDVLLLRRPNVWVRNRPTTSVVSADGTEIVTAIVRNISLEVPGGLDPFTPEYTRQVIEENELSVAVAFGRINEISEEQAGTLVRVRPTAEPEQFEMDFRVPQSEVPTQVQFAIDCDLSGRSELVSSVFCRPALFGTSPRTGPTDGSSVEVSLFGQALIPTGENGADDFEALRLRVTKGGRTTVVPLDLIRRQKSQRTQIVFSMPASPDGRPGPADLELEVTVPARPHISPTQVLESRIVGTYVYGDRHPNFGPRGVRLIDSAVKLRAARFLTHAEPRASVDLLTLIEGTQALPFISLYGAQNNGMFVRFGSRVRAGNPVDPTQRSPVDLAIGGFMPQGGVAGVILNRGDGNVGRHSLVFGSDINPALRFLGTLPSVESGWRCKAGRLNADAIDDLVALPTPGSRFRNPAKYLSKVGAGFDRLAFQDFGGVQEFTALEVADLDGDRFTDVVFAQAGLQPRVVIAYGNGLGGFSVVSEPKFDLGALGYKLDAESRVVDVHLVGNAANPALAFVISGTSWSPQTPAALAILKRTAPRTFADLTATDLLTMSSDTETFKESVLGDLTYDGLNEIVIVTDGEASEPLRVFQYDTRGLRMVQGAIDFGIEPIEDIQGLAIGLAADSRSSVLTEDYVALFLAHKTSVAGGVENRVSTFVSVPRQSTPKLLSPSPAVGVGEDVLAVSTGRFVTKSALTSNVPNFLDAWVATPTGLRQLINDGLGEMQLDATGLPVAGIIPKSMITVDASRAAPGQLQAPAFLVADGRVGAVLPNQTNAVTWLQDSEKDFDLRTLAPPHLRNRSVSESSFLVNRDVDGDGVADLVVLLNLAEGAGQQKEAFLILLRGLETVPFGAFPFALPVTPHAENGVTHGNTSSVVVGDFAIESGTKVLELAVAIPKSSSPNALDGDHVRFYRYDGRGGFTPSYVDPTNTVMVVGREPAFAVAGDFNSDGRDDLAIATQHEADRQLRVFYNFSTPVAGGGAVDVDLAKFQAAPANPIPFAGRPLLIRGGDLNGDQVPDVMLSTLQSNATLDDQQFIFFLSPGRVQGVGSGGLIPPERTGNLVRPGNEWVPRNTLGTAALGDLNGDGMVDMITGWKKLPGDDRNLRILFGSSL